MGTDVGGSGGWFGHARSCPIDPGIVAKRSLPAEDAPPWRENRDLIYRDIHANFWSAARGAFVQYKDARRSTPRRS